MGAVTNPNSSPSELQPPCMFRPSYRVLDPPRMDGQAELAWVAGCIYVLLLHTLLGCHPSHYYGNRLNLRQLRSSTPMHYATAMPNSKHSNKTPQWLRPSLNLKSHTPRYHYHRRWRVQKTNEASLHWLLTRKKNRANVRNNYVAGNARRTMSCDVSLAAMTSLEDVQWNKQLIHYVFESDSDVL